MAGQDLLAACLSIDPVTGDLETEGLCSEVGAKLFVSMDGKTGELSVRGHEMGGSEGARRRAARFKKLVNERVARNEEERVLLANPTCLKTHYLASLWRSGCGPEGW